MNSTLELIAGRKSCRNFSEKGVTQAVKEQIVEAALRAPTAGNMMLYTIIEISDQQIKERLVKTCDNQPFIARAPLVLLFAADFQRWYDYYQLSRVSDYCTREGINFTLPQEADLLLANCDALIAAHTAVLAAESLGLASCYIGDIVENYEIHKELFALPDYVFPTIMVCFGYPGKSAIERALADRFEKRYVVVENRYRRLSAEELTQMFTPRDQRECKGRNYLGSAENFGQHFYQKKTGAPFSVEMRRSVRAALANWSGSPKPDEEKTKR